MRDKMGLTLVLILSQIAAFTFSSIALAEQAEVRLHFGAEHALSNEMPGPPKVRYSAPVEVLIRDESDQVIFNIGPTVPYSNEGPPYPDLGFFDEDIKLPVSMVRITGSTVIQGKRIPLFDRKVQLFEGLQHISVARDVVFVRMKPIALGGVSSTRGFEFRVEGKEDVVSLNAYKKGNDSVLISLDQNPQYEFAAFLPKGAQISLFKKGGKTAIKTIGPISASRVVNEIGNTGVLLNPPSVIYYVFEPVPEGVHLLGNSSSELLTPFFRFGRDAQNAYRIARPVIREGDFLNRDYLGVERQSLSEGKLVLEYGGLPDQLFRVGESVVIPFSLIHVMDHKYQRNGVSPTSFELLVQGKSFFPRAIQWSTHLTFGQSEQVAYNVTPHDWNDPSNMREVEAQPGFEDRFLANQGLHVPPGEYTIRANYADGSVKEFLFEAEEVIHSPSGSSCDRISQYLANAERQSPRFYRHLIKTIRFAYYWKPDIWI